MHFLLASAAFAASCNAFAFSWGKRATKPALPPLPLAQFDTPKYARPLTLEEALSGANASVHTIKPHDLEDARSKFPTLVIPNHATPPEKMQSLDKDLTQFEKRQGTCSNVRVRTEWDHYSDNDRQAYIDAIKCLMDTPPSGQYDVSRSRYDDLVGLHQSLTPDIHGNAIFLLWHRYYLWTFEQLLRDDCGFDRELPWFDETRYASNFPASSIFSSQWFGGVDIGGECVTDGQFANLALVFGPGTGNTPHCLARNNNNTKTANTGNAIVDACNSRSNYADMAACAEGGAHAWGHNGIGAVMQDVYGSAADPLFFLHHGFIDRNFRIWQNEGGNARVTTVDGADGSDTPLTLDTKISLNGFRPDVRIGDILNTQGPTLCYKYNY